MKRLLRLAGVLVPALTMGSTAADVVTDGSLGDAANIGRLQNLHAGTDHATIAPNLGATSGGNLFHSFYQFNLATGQSATFQADASIRNIIARVSGWNGSAFTAQPSAIRGAIRTSGTAADLYLLNPAGIVFGPGAALDVGGSFHASTADYLRFADSRRFDAHESSAPLLTSAAPEAFGFLDQAVADLSVSDAWLEVGTGQTIGLVGGDIELTDAVLLAPAGQVGIASAASRGEVGIAGDGLDAGQLTRKGDIAITDTGDIDSRPANPHLFRLPVGNIDTSGDSGGRVVIRGGRFSVDYGYVFADSADGSGGQVDIRVDQSVHLDHEARITAGTLGSAAAGTVSVQTVDLRMDNGGLIDASSAGSGAGGTIIVDASGSVIASGATTPSDCYYGANSGLFTDTLSGGAGGTVTVTAPQVRLEQGGRFAAVAYGTGHGGSIDITATDNLDLSGAGAQGPSGVVTSSLGTGNAGDITLRGAQLTVRDDALVQSALLGAAANAATHAGNILVEADHLRLANRGQIATQTETAGQAGNITIRASDGVVVESPAGDIQSGVFSTSTGSGNGGGIALTTPYLELRGGGLQVSSAGAGDAGDIELRLERGSLERGGHVSTSVSGTGNGGTLTIDAERELNITGSNGAGFSSGLYALTRGQGAGGDVRVSAPRVTLNDGGLITAAATGNGDAGNIDLAIGDILEMRNAAIQTQALATDGGNISITARERIHLVDSTISTAVGSGSGNGGNINIDPHFVILNDSRIVANAFGGNGGNIHITASYFYASPASVLDASSALGIDGEVVIDSPIVELGKGISELPKGYLDASTLLRTPCAVRTNLDHSSFLVQPRLALPLGPEQPLPLIGVAKDSGPRHRPEPATAAAQRISGLSDAPYNAWKSVECARPSRVADDPSET